MMNRQNDLLYSNPQFIKRILLRALEEIIGQDKTRLILTNGNFAQRASNHLPDQVDQQASSLDFCKIQAGLEQLFGALAGRGIALRLGKACFLHALRELGPEAGCKQPEFRLLPFRKRVQAAGTWLQEFINENTNLRVQAYEKPDYFLWEIEHCPICSDRRSDSSVCYFYVGVLQEAMSWVSGGKFYNVIERDCIAKGDAACRIIIDKLPVE